MKKIGEDISAMDVVRGVAEGVLSQIPYVGAFVQAVESVKGNVLQKRYEKWQEEVGKRLSQLEEDVRRHLGENEIFATTLIKATELAAQTNTIKSEYLANAVQNAALNPLEEDNLIILLNLIAKYTVSHFKILLYFENPAAYNTKRETLLGGSAMHFFYNRYPDFDRNRATLIMNELHRDGLITSSSEATVSFSGMEAKRTSELGDLFISFFGIKEADYE